MAIIEWNKIESHVHNSTILDILKKSPQNFILPVANIIPNSCHPKKVRCITWSRLVLSHLLGTYPKHSFHGTLNHVFDRINDINQRFPYISQCSNFSNERLTLLSKIKNIVRNFLLKKDSLQCQFLLLVIAPSKSSNTPMQNAKITYISHLRDLVFH